MSTLMAPASYPATVAGLDADGLTGDLAGPDIPAGSSLLTLSANATVAIGNSMTIEGRLMGADAEGEKALAEALLNYTVTGPDGTTIDGNATTDADGRFAVHHVAAVTGAHSLAATYDGNGTFDGTSEEVAWEAVSAQMPDLIVRPGNVVEDADGTVVHTGADAIQWAVNSGDVVLVAAGTHQVSGDIYMRSGTTLMGEGSTQTTLDFAYGGIIMDGVSNTAVKGFHITGAATCQSWANGVTVTDHVWEDIHLDHVTKGIINNAIGTRVQSGGVIDGLTYRQVFVDTPATWGFLINGNNFDGWVKNVLFEDCTAIRCGNSLGVTDPNAADSWIPGFDLAERANVDGMRLVNCRADYNWESGFHLEIAPEVRNVVFENCTANYNGQKPGALYGAGFFCGDQAGFNECTFIDATGVGNTRGGVNYDVPNVQVVSFPLPFSK